MLEYSIDIMTKNMLPKRREEYKTLFSKYLNIEAITKDMKESLVKNFTADELKALADFYETPIGKSALKKMYTYDAEMMPKLKAELLKAQEKANQEK